jgi:hypothetical protein
LVVVVVVGAAVGVLGLPSVSQESSLTSHPMDSVMMVHMEINSLHLVLLLI